MTLCHYRRAAWLRFLMVRGVSRATAGGNLLRGRRLTEAPFPDPPSPCSSEGAPVTVDFWGNSPPGKRCCRWWRLCLTVHGAPAPFQLPCTPQRTSSDPKCASTDQLTPNRHPTDCFCQVESSWLGHGSPFSSPPPPLRAGLSEPPPSPLKQFRAAQWPDDSHFLLHPSVSSIGMTRRTTTSS